MPTSYLESLPLEVITRIFIHLRTNDLWALCRTSRSMLQATRGMLGLRILYRFAPKLVEDIERWNGNVEEGPVSPLGIPLSGLSIDLSSFLLIGPPSRLPPLRLPKVIRRLNLVYESKRDYMDQHIPPFVRDVMGELLTNHSHTLLRLHLSLQNVRLDEVGIPSFVRLRSFSLDMCPNLKASPMPRPLPDLSCLPLPTLTSLTLHRLHYTRIDPILDLITHLPSLTYLALRFYKDTKTAEILEHLVRAKCTRLKTLDLLENSRHPSAGISRERDIQSVLGGTQTDQQFYDRRIINALTTLHDQGIMLEDLRLEDITTIRTSLYTVVNKLWSSSLRVFHLTGDKHVPLFGYTHNAKPWRFLLDLVLQDIGAMYHFSLPPQGTPPSFPELRTLTLKRAGYLSPTSNHGMPSDLDPGAWNGSYTEMAMRLFPSLEKLEIGDVPFDFYRFTMVPGLHVTLKPPMNLPQAARELLRHARYVGPKSLTFPKGYTAEKWLGFPLTPDQLGKIGRVYFGYGE
ncbi:MAG: hypothetical protein DHS80DRAFT_25117 [Piptocephalis tieghemiana]|nr:MAG: hypothetical protein DHS80DRAFT_25117 [Piptocephalis tieghemiana]